MSDARSPGDAGDERVVVVSTSGGGSPLRWLALVLASTGATLLLGGVLSAFASSGAPGATSTDRYRLVAQAANPFLALLAVLAVAVIVLGRERTLLEQAAARGALVIATAVSIVVVLLAVNGILTDVVGEASGLFRGGAMVSRLGTIALGGYGLWLASAVKPAPRRKS